MCSCTFLTRQQSQCTCTEVVKHKVSLYGQAQPVQMTAILLAASAMLLSGIVASHMEHLDSFRDVRHTALCCNMHVTQTLCQLSCIATAWTERFATACLLDIKHTMLVAARPVHTSTSWPDLPAGFQPQISYLTSRLQATLIACCLALAKPFALKVVLSHVQVS